MIEIYKDVFMWGDVVVPRSSLLPAIAVKKFPRSYRSHQQLKEQANKWFHPEIVEWLLSN